jgi:1,4-dihydroxy-2-naphthoyl-CoA hydrolase
MTVDALNAICQSTLVSHLGIEFLEATENKIVATMPVDERTVQPQKVLHGGASMALAETVGSAGSFMLVDLEKYFVVGLEINGNHVGSVSSGNVTATATLLHKGKRTHVWDIKITDENNRLVSVCRITNMVVEHKKVEDN